MNGASILGWSDFQHILYKVDFGNCKKRKKKDLIFLRKSNGDMGEMFTYATSVCVCVQSLSSVSHNNLSQINLISYRDYPNAI